MAKAKASEAIQTVKLERLQKAAVEIPIIGLTPVIPHKWSEKMIRMLPGHPDGDKAKKVKGPHKPEEEAEECLYKFDDGRLGIKAVAFKAAIIGATRLFANLTLVETKTLVFVEGEFNKDGEELIEIKYKKKILNEGLPRLPNGSPDLRYRYFLYDWSAVLRVRYIPIRIERDSIVTLVDAAGLGGVGDWRPSAPKSLTGSFGTFQVDDTIEGGIRDVA